MTNIRDGEPERKGTGPSAMKLLGQIQTQFLIFS